MVGSVAHGAKYYPVAGSGEKPARHRRRSGSGCRVLAIVSPVALPDARSLLGLLRSSSGEMVRELEELTSAESPSSDLAATAACAEVVAEMTSLAVAPERIELAGRTHLRWRFGSAESRPPAVLLVGHFDTVWPLGTLSRWPFSLDGAGRATGPGCFDMKAGIVQMMHALRLLDDLDGLAFVLTSDEELGSPTSKALIEETARGAGAALVLEPSDGGALKGARKGTSLYELHIAGRAAHAGLEPERGLNATVELAHQVLAICDLADAPGGTSVTPTVASAGTTTNTVPAEASLHVDVRAWSLAEQSRVDEAMRRLTPRIAGSRLELLGGINRPPLEWSCSRRILPRAERLAESLGLAPLESVEVGGGSDGNFTAAAGVPTLDGLGAVGGNAHAEGEWVLVDAMPERAGLLALLADELRRSPPG